MARPTTPLLSEERILEAVRRLGADGDFTLSRLAAELGVRVSSIYHHVPSKAAIVHLLRRDWITRLQGELGQATGFDRLLMIVRSYAGFASDIPALVPLLVAEPLYGDQARWLYEEIAAILSGLGVPDENILSVIGAIDGLILGSAFDLLAPPFQAAQLSPETQPHLARALQSHPEGEDRRLHLGRTLEDVLTGLVAGAEGEPDTGRS